MGAKLTQIVSSSSLTRNTENLTAVALYAPKADAKKSVMDSLYDEIDGALDSVSPQHVRTVTAKWNAKSGAADMAIWYTLDIFAVFPMCAYGGRLIILTSTTYLVVSNTQFHHPQRHFRAWASNNYLTRNQVIHM